MQSAFTHSVTGIVLGILNGFASVSAAEQLRPYPQRPLSADQIVAQAYLATHGRLVRNAVTEQQGNDVAMVVNRATPRLRERGRKPSIQAFESYVNSRPENPAVESQQMAILTSGSARGTAILFTNYAAEGKTSKVMMWLPALRKVRRVIEPRHDEVWFGTNLTFGELVLRRPEHEDHELLGREPFRDCLKTLDLEDWEKTRRSKALPPPQCEHRGKPIYRVKSATKFTNWWYDYHISEIDEASFAVYRTVYFKDGESIKTVDMDWQSLGQADPRIIYPRYVYAHTLTDGKESLVFVPRSTIKTDTELPDDFWSERTLRRSRR